MLFSTRIYRLVSFILKKFQLFWDSGLPRERGGGGWDELFRARDLTRGLGQLRKKKKGKRNGYFVRENLAWLFKNINFYRFFVREEGGGKPIWPSVGLLMRQI